MLEQLGQREEQLVLLELVKQDQLVQLALLVGLQEQLVLLGQLELLVQDQQEQLE